MAMHSSVLTWKISWSEEPGGIAWDCKELGKTENTHTRMNQAAREGKNGGLSRTSEGWRVSPSSMLFSRTSLASVASQAAARLRSKEPQVSLFS